MVAGAGLGAVPQAVPPAWRVYSNAELGITLHHPPHWERNTRYVIARIDGPDGHVQLCVTGGQDLDDAAFQFVAQRLRPFGANPMIAPVRVHGRDARLIWPSDEVPAQLRPREGALVIRHPMDARDRGRYLVLLADAGHIQDIISSVQFVESPPGRR
jgi:hypothetical protein